MDYKFVLNTDPEKAKPAKPAMDRCIDRHIKERERMRLSRAIIRATMGLSSDEFIAETLSRKGYEHRWARYAKDIQDEGKMSDILYFSKVISSEAFEDGILEDGWDVYT
jgi:hypothetical protein